MKFRWLARFKSASGAGVTDFGGGGNLLNGAVQYYEALQWERPYLVQALQQLRESESKDGLRVILGLMMSGAGWCRARKTLVFNTIVSRVQVPVIVSRQAGEADNS